MLEFTQGDSSTSFDIGKGSKKTHDSDADSEELMENEFFKLQRRKAKLREKEMISNVQNLLSITKDTKDLGTITDNSKVIAQELIGAR